MNDFLKIALTTELPPIKIDGRFRTLRKKEYIID